MILISSFFFQFVHKDRFKFLSESIHFIMSKNILQYIDKWIIIIIIHE